MNDLTLLIKTFERPDCLRRLLQSIRRYYPDIPIIVGDDSWKPYPEVTRSDRHITHLRLTANIGLSAGRNACVRAAKTELVCVLDDDFVFEEDTRLDELVRVLRTQQADIVAGAIRVAGEIRHFEGDYVLHDERLHLCRRAIASPARVDVAFNFFVAYRKTLLTHPWDQQYKMAEHAPFFWSAKGSHVKTWYVPSVVIDHVQQGNFSYNKQRTAHLDKYEALFAGQFPRGIWMRENGLEAQSHNKSNKAAMATTITGIVSTVSRAGSLARLIETWLYQIPTTPLIIVDQSEDHYTRGMRLPSPIVAIETKHDVGGCQGYQLALERVQTEHFSLLEDDFELTRKSDLPLLALMVRDTPYSLIGGALYRDGKDLQMYRGNFVWMAADHLHVEPVAWDDPRAIGQFDIIPNFYVANTHDVRGKMGGWDCELKLVDHLGFYLRMKEAGLRVGYMPAVSANHMKARARQERNGKPVPWKKRKDYYRQKFLRKRGLRLVTGIEQMELRA